MITYRVLRYLSDKEANGIFAPNNNDDDDDNKENEIEEYESEIGEETNNENNNNDNAIIRTPTIVVDYENILNIVTGLYKEQYLIYNDKNQHVPKGTFTEKSTV